MNFFMFVDRFKLLNIRLQLGYEVFFTLKFHLQHPDLVNKRLISKFLTMLVMQRELSAQQGLFHCLITFLSQLANFGSQLFHLVVRILLFESVL